MTKWILTLSESNLPKYLALADAIEEAVENGTLLPGQQLPTHRDLADELGITVGTVTRGYGEARNRGIISGTVGRGTYVSTDVNVEKSLVPASSKSASIEMGLITPLYGLDPSMSKALVRLGNSPGIQKMLAYSDPVGHVRDREKATVWLGEYGLHTHSDEVIITAGAQHGLNCILTSLFSSGDRIAVENMTYPGFKTLAVMLGLTLVPVDLDDEGMVPEALAIACRREKIRAVFLMPGQQNPTTGRMSQQRRVEIAQIAQKSDLLVIEDCAYDLSSDSVVQPFINLLPERTVLIAGVSKYFGAGLRTAYLVAHCSFHNRLRQAVLNTVWMASPLTVRLASLLIENGSAKSALNKKLKEAKIRVEMVKRIMAGLSFKCRTDGFFVWLNLPEPWSGPQFELAAAERKISVFCADKFAVGADKPDAAIRISLTGPDTRDELASGLMSIKEIIGDGPRLSALL